MPFTVEDGTGLSNANSYLAVADADSYFADRGNEDWAAQDTTAKEQALVRATFAINAWLRGKWRGAKFTATQSLAWPRSGVVDEDGYELATDAVPQPVKDATAEVALIELTERFLQTSVDRSNMVASQSVGPISVTYRGDAPSIKYYPHVMAILTGLASTGGTALDVIIGMTADELADSSADLDFFDYPGYFNLIKS